MKKNQVKNKIFYIFFLLLFVLMQQPAFASDTRVTGMYVAKSDGGAGFEIELTANPQYKVFFVGDPPRIVIDVQNAVLATSINRSSLAGTAIKNVRTGIHEDGKLRIVLDLQRETPFHYNFSGDKSGGKSRLFISLGAVKSLAKKAAVAAAKAPQAQAQVQAPPKTKMQAQTQTRMRAQSKAPLQTSISSPSSILAQMQAKVPMQNLPPVLAQAKVQSQTYVFAQAPIPAPIQAQTQKQILIPIPIPNQPTVPPKAQPATASSLSQAQLQQPQPQPQPASQHQPQVQPQTQTSPPIFESKPYLLSLLEPDAGQKPRDIVIVIDPGHGGRDPGASGLRGLKEKDVVLAIAKNMQRFLNQQNGFSVILTRDGDSHIGLRERLRIAHVNKADVFVSLHADIYRNTLAKGTSIYALSQDGATNEAARWLAERENASELGQINPYPGNALRSVLIDVAQSASIKNSLVIGDSILQQLATINKLHNKKVDQANFVVLTSPDIPSLLIETGFISDPREEKNLRDSKYRERFAKMVSQGLINYFSLNPLPGTCLALHRQ